MNAEEYGKLVMQTLKPCPFCASDKVVLAGTRSGVDVIECRNCLALAPADKWNIRSPVVVDDAFVQKVRAAISDGLQKARNEGGWEYGASVTKALTAPWWPKSHLRDALIEAFKQS